MSPRDDRDAVVRAEYAGIDERMLEKHHKEVSQIMKKELRQWKHLRIIGYIVYPVLIGVSVVLLLRSGGAADIAAKVDDGLFALAMLMVAQIFMIQFHAQRINVGIRKDINELTLAVRELKEWAGSTKGSV